jgi:hypothetical protein
MGLLGRLGNSNCFYCLIAVRLDGMTRLYLPSTGIKEYYHKNQDNLQKQVGTSKDPNVPNKVLSWTRLMFYESLSNTPILRRNIMTQEFTFVRLKNRWPNAPNRRAEILAMSTGCNRTSTSFNCIFYSRACFRPKFWLFPYLFVASTCETFL